MLDPAGTRRFRVLLFAALPDRIHAEVLSALGSPQAILDGGDGRLAVTFVADRESFVGEAEAGVLSRLLGVELDLGGLARALLLGDDAGAPCRIRRSGSTTPGLPDRIAFESDSSLFELTLERRRRLETDQAALGTGVPPSGTHLRPLEELDDDPRRFGEPPAPPPQP